MLASSKSIKNPYNITTATFFSSFPNVFIGNPGFSIPPAAGLDSGLNIEE